MTQSTFQSENRPNSERISERDAVDHDDDTTFEDPRIARERAEERERAEARDSSRERAVQATREPNLAHDNHGLGTSYLGNDTTTDEPWQQWRQIQANFVDNPRDAVSEAHGLVGNLIDNIVRKFEQERGQLEHRWSSGEDVSTEDLRTCLQTYRDFFGRLLAKSTEPKPS
jgi:hypothetical protein